MRIKNLVFYFLVLGGLFVYASCGTTNTETPEEKLDAYCIRQCVLETGDSSLCDSKCDCASKILSEKLSQDEFSKLVIDITREDFQDLEESKSIKEFSYAVKRCKSAKF